MRWSGLTSLDGLGSEAPTDSVEAVGTAWETSHIYDNIGLL